MSVPKSQPSKKKSAQGVATSLERQKNALDVLRRALDRVRSSSPEAKREKALDALTKAYRANELALVLGAGVSMDNGLPSWDTLLQELLLETIQSDASDTGKSRVLAKVFNQAFRPAPLVAARYLRTFFRSKVKENPLAFDEAVRDVLYAGYDPAKTPPLMIEIRKLCMAVGKSPNLRSIITYNYDDLIESDLTANGNDVRFKPIYQPGTHAAPEELPIYHVHGFLPRSGNLSEANRIVLSEDFYHQQYSDVYGWSNLVQINTFRESSCLFIGVSLTDPNQRRLLDIAKTLRGDDATHHYWVTRRYREDDVVARVRKVLSENSELLDAKLDATLTEDVAVKDLIKLMESYMETDARSFGIEPIWINEYSEVPAILRELRQMKRA